MPVKNVPGLQFTPAQIEALPAYGNAAVYARVLGIGRSTMTLWIQRFKMPVRNISPKRYLIDKAPVVEWMIQTGRYVPPQLVTLEVGVYGA
mgnify:FL=1